MKRTFLVKKDLTGDGQDNWLIMSYGQYAEWRKTEEGRNREIVFGKLEACSDGHSKYEHKGTEFGEDADFSPYYAPGIIAIDACTAFSGKVNCLVIED